MNGMSAQTGQFLAARQHLAQSISDILSTPLGSRVMRREYGSQLPRLIDWPDNGPTRLKAMAATAMALMRWESRIRLTSVSLSLGTAAGQTVLDLEGTLVDSNEDVSLRIPLQLGAIV